MKKPAECQQHAKITIEKMCLKIKAKTKAALARAIGVTPQSINTAIKRDKIPDRWFAMMEEKYGVTKEELCWDLPPENKIAAKIQPGPGNQSIMELSAVERITPLKILIEWMNEIFDREQGEYEAMIFFDDIKKRYPSFADFLDQRGNKKAGLVNDQKEAC